MNQQINYHDLQRQLTEHENILLISGKSLDKTSIKQKLNLSSPRFHRFSEFTENPTLNEVIHAKNALQKARATAIVAIGGGTAMDIAKLTKFYKESSVSTTDTTPPNASSISDIPVYAIPTTFGSGSESTSFAVMYIQEKKFSIAHPDILPNFYLLDPELSRSLPLYTKASACLDALCQAIESYWANSATLESRQNALFAITQIAKLFESYITSPTSAVDKIIVEASNRAGKAINVTKTTAPHALSYFLSAQYNISHGHAVAMCLKNTFAVNEEKSQTSNNQTFSLLLKEIYRALNVDNALSAKQLITQFLDKAGLASQFHQIGLNSEQQIELAVNSVNIERLKNHPVALTEQDLKHIFFDG
jgi:alcohol dehydrogenase class IV